MTPSEGAAQIAELEVAKARVVAVAAYARLERHRAAADALPAGVVADVEASYRLALLDEQIARVRLEVLRRPPQVESPATQQGDSNQQGEPK